MRAYGLSLLLSGDLDVAGCRENGRAGATHNLPGPGGDISEYRSLRGGKRAAVRRTAKRIARCEGAREIREGLG